MWSMSRCYKQDKLMRSGLVGELDNHWGSVVVSYCCEKLVAEAGIVQEPRGREIYTIGSCYQVTANEDCNRLRRPSLSYSGL
jgi:hypothetical protein